MEAAARKAAAFAVWRRSRRQVRCGSKCEPAQPRAVTVGSDRPGIGDEVVPLEHGSLDTPSDDDAPELVVRDAFAQRESTELAVRQPEWSIGFVAGRRQRTGAGTGLDELVHLATDSIYQCKPLQRDTTQHSFRTLGKFQPTSAVLGFPVRFLVFTVFGFRFSSADFGSQFPN